MPTSTRHMSCLLAAAVAIIARTPAKAEPGFKKLTGAQIAAAFSGKELTDNVHWREVYERDGRLRNYEMGPERLGRWRVADSKLCITVGSYDESCFEVWKSGANVELRRDSDEKLPLSTQLQSPSDPKKNQKVDRIKAN